MHFRFRLAPLCISTGLKMGCLFLGELASAQTTAGAFVGTATDDSGSAVPNIKVMSSDDIIGFSVFSLTATRNCAMHATVAVDRASK
jgi:hypothetical protein